jgi:hypothetical protein
VKHAGQAALDSLEPLLSLLREVPGIREKNRGTFYRGSRAFLHFHEDAAGLFADIRTETDFGRMRVSTAGEQRRLLRLVRQTLMPPTDRPNRP